jgi:hypothetical protein
MVDLLRIAIERKGGQPAFARHYGIAVTQGVRRQVSALPVSVLRKYH